ncbi:hypothetical protein AC482_05715 [miscellaneous Crenarchaeota group-15 archaeon DG-45]|uniref:Uncharacterized protein n=1 Tax=miscellaneous Crenarchaeota group-15 archaeon DG-45 TaxID=1685127 RepID=A0A0M0BMF3_9ARCH|nr:MAG: hypothetical protein AC482_05715 [miscellaneous Crenarchaeota group-15 archaeon DG-45]
MTHTHHRRGSRESLQKDFVVLAMIDREAEAQHAYGGPLEARVEKLLRILERHGPVALLARASGRRLRYMRWWEPRMDSGIHRAASLGEIVHSEELPDEGLTHAVYTRGEAVEGVLRELREADLGISIVVSGVFDDVFDICRRAGTEPHTVNMSLGTWGRAQLMPRGAVLELCTMCGHAMISSRLAEAMIDRVRRGALAPEEAAVELGKQCTCNIFNVERATEIIRNAAAGGA